MNRQSTSELLGHAVEQARRHWRSRQEETAADATAAPAPTAFTIAISREAGAHGPAIARAVGERLGWPVYDRELLQHLAEEMGLRTKLLESVDEKHAGWLQECMQRFTSMPAVSAGSYVRRLVELLLALAAHGECVIVGRGAAQVLPAATTVRVRLVGPLPERIRAIQDRFGISREEATRWIDKTDADRSHFIQAYFHKDPADPCLYDLVLNSTRLPVEKCADLIVEALHGFEEARVAKLTEAVSVCN